MQLLMLEDKLKVELGTAGMRMVSRLSAVYSQWYCEPERTQRNAVSNFGTLGYASGSWLTQLFGTTAS